METQTLCKKYKPKSGTANTPFFKPAIQKKLSVGSANDSYEVEADNMANKVMRVPNPKEEQITHSGTLVQRKCAACEEEKIQKKPLAESITPLIQRSSELTSSSGDGGIAPRHIESQINSSRGSGSSMDHGTKNFMESRFGTDFSDVKIHTGSQAVQMSRELNAQAFTVGNDIYFSEGKYSPNSDSGKHLLAHELTHTVQQNGGIGRKVQKYSHEDCDEAADLRPHIWPADHLAKAMIGRAVTALAASPISATTEALLDKFFRDHSASTVSSVLGVFRRIKAAFDADDYTYECETGCDNGNAYTYKIWSDIHLCMDHWRGKANKCLASVIIHEFSHYYGGTSDHEYFTECNSTAAPASLTVAQAVANADSYEGFAYDV